MLKVNYQISDQKYPTRQDSSAYKRSRRRPSIVSCRVEYAARSLFSTRTDQTFGRFGRNLYCLEIELIFSRMGVKLETAESKQYD